MKKSRLIGLIVIVIVLSNCKNNKAQKEIVPETEIEQVEEKVIDTATIINRIETEVDSITPLDIEKPISDSKTSDEKTQIIEAAKTTEEEVEELKEEIIETAQEVVANEEIIVEETIVKEKESAIEPEVEIEKVVEKEIEDEIEVGPIIEKVETVLDPNAWVVPSKYENMENPTNPKVDLAIGKSLYSKHCKSCHGKEGYGDGPKAEEVEGDLGDFSSKKFQSQSDGALYYKAIIGRLDMPNYTKKIPDDEDRWLIVNYMRTMGQ